MRNFLSGFERVKQSARCAGILSGTETDEEAAILISQALESSPADAADVGSPDPEPQA